MPFPKSSYPFPSFFILQALRRSGLVLDKSRKFLYSSNSSIPSSVYPHPRNIQVCGSLHQRDSCNASLTWSASPSLGYAAPILSPKHPPPFRSLASTLNHSLPSQPSDCNQALLSDPSSLANTHFRWLLIGHDYRWPS